ncbi:OPT oligopeptide transporter protein-domain-containing protein [Pilobolus umbonatus]|nr:OPT oligopeptide transporter protein-domain-containing protein [Pilobolus umbonatus]
MYFGLQTGWISMMSLQSSLLGFALFKPFQPMLRQKFGPIENVVLQTTAVATATMPLAAGFVGVIPAMELMTLSDHSSGAVVLDAYQLILWSLGVAFFGVLFAVPLRKQTIIREKLRFPSGTATAEMISLLHQSPKSIHSDIDERPRGLRRRGEGLPLLQVNQPLPEYQKSSDSLFPPASFEDTWTLKLKGLLVSFSLSSLYTLLSYFVPTITTLPIFNWITINYVDFRSWEWYFNPSFSYVGQGIIMGLPTTLSMLAGCIVGWGILSPLAFYADWAPGPISDWKSGSKGWILWVSLGIMIAESCISLLIVLIKTVVKTCYRERRIELESNEIEDDEEKDASPEQQVPKSVTVVGLIMAIFLCVYLVRLVFGSDVIPEKMTLLAVLIAMLLSVLGVRALGETDLNPVSGIGKISQVIFAGVMPGGILANLIAGGIAEAGAQQAGDLMQDLKTGHLLGASPRAQFYGQMIGSFASVFIATAAYLLYRTVYNIPSPEFPVPTAQVWLDMSRLVNGHPLPPKVSHFVFAFGVLFTVFVVLKELYPHKRWTLYIPQGIAFAIGMYNPPSFTLARVIGGYISYKWNAYCEMDHRHKDKPVGIHAWLEPYRVIGKVFIVVVASGFVLGEGTFAIVNMTMRALNIPHF